VTARLGEGDLDGLGARSAASALAVAAARAIGAGIDLSGAAHEVALDVAATAAAALLAAGPRAGALAGADAGPRAEAKAHRALGERVALDAGELGEARRQVAVDDVVEDLLVLVLEELDLRGLGRHVLGVGIARALGLALASRLAFLALGRR